MTRKGRLAIAVAIGSFSGMVGSAYGQVSLTGTTTYTQNFDTLSNTGTANTWTNNTTIPGWFAYQSGGSATAGAPAAYRADNGGSNSGSIYSYGTTATTERALGSVGSGTPGNFLYGAQFLNPGAETLNIATFNLTYTGEQWRNGGNATAQFLTAQYAVGASSINDTSVTWTNISTPTTHDADFTSLINTATAAALDGNAAANRSVVTAPTTTIAGGGVAPGTSFWIRFSDPNDAGNDHGLSVDDFSLAFTRSAATTNSTIITASPLTLTPAGPRTSLNTTYAVTLTKTGAQATGYSTTPSAGLTAASGAFTAADPENKTLTVGYSTTGIQASPGTVVVHNNLNASDPDETITVGTTTVLADRLLNSTVAIGKTLINLNYTGNTTIVSTGANLDDDHATRVTLLQGGTGGPQIFGGVMANVDDGTADVLFNSAASSETRGYQATFFQSGSKSTFFNLSTNGEGLANESVKFARVTFTGTGYQAAALTTNAGAVTVGDAVTLTNAASDDNTTFGLRANLRVTSLTKNLTSAFTGLTLSAGTPGSEATSGSVIGGSGSSGTNVVQTSSQTIGFNATQALNGNYTGTYTLGIQYADQTILGTANVVVGTPTWTVAYNLTTGSTGAGTNVFTGGGFTSAVNAITGSFTQSGGAATFGAVTGTGTFVVNGGTLTAASIKATSLTVGAGGTVSILPNGTNAALSVLSSLSVAGKLDIADNDVLLHSTDTAAVHPKLDAVVAAIAAARNTVSGGGFDGTWNGTSGINSSALQASLSTNGIEDRSIGYMLVGDYFFGGIDSFDGVAVSATDILIKYTRNGDADLSGVVDDNDVSLVGSFYADGSTTHHWYDGDFDGNGAVDDNDVAVLGTFYDLSQPALSAAALSEAYGPAFTAAFEAGLAANVGGSAVPEPASLGLLAVGGLAMLGRRRRVAK